MLPWISNSEGNREQPRVCYSHWGKITWGTRQGRAASCPSACCPREGGPHPHLLPGASCEFPLVGIACVPCVSWSWARGMPAGFWGGGRGTVQTLGDPLTLPLPSTWVRQQAGERQSSEMGWMPPCLCQVQFINYCGRWNIGPQRHPRRNPQNP